MRWLSLMLDHVILEGDSSIVISALQNPTCVMDWRIENLSLRLPSLAFQPPFCGRLEKSTKMLTSAHYAAYRVATRFS
jgi:hypothetical protein